MSQQITSTASADDRTCQQVAELEQHRGRLARLVGELLARYWQRHAIAPLPEGQATDKNES